MKDNAEAAGPGGAAAAGTSAAAAVDLEARERSPLRARTLDDFLTRIRTRATPRQNLAELLQGGLSLPIYLVFVSLVNAVVQVFVILGMYFYMHSTGRRLVPLCARQSKFGLAQDICYVTSYAFWTFPILSAFAVVVIFWKSMLEKRLFYECLAHRIFLQYLEYPWLVSPTFWFLCFYGLSGFTCLLFLDTSRVSTILAPDEMLYGVLTYLSPLTQFAFVLVTQWSVNHHVVSLATFFQKHETASEYMGSCAFVAVGELRQAFENVEELFVYLAKKEHMSLDVKTHELMRLLLDEVEQERAVAPIYDSVAAKMKRSCTCTKCLNIMRPLWIQRLLYFRRLQDNHSAHFRLLARIYLVFMCVACFFFLWMMVHGTQEFLVIQQYLSQDKAWVPNTDKVFHNELDAVLHSLDNSSFLRH